MKISFFGSSHGCSRFYPPVRKLQIALDLMEGAAVITRAQQLRSHGVPVPAAALDFRPRPLR